MEPAYQDITFLFKIEKDFQEKLKENDWIVLSFGKIIFFYEKLEYSIPEHEMKTLFLSRNSNRKYRQGIESYIVTDVSLIHVLTKS